MADIVTVEAVEGRAIDHPQTGLRITGTATVPNTREMRRALEVGDLKKVARPKIDDAPEKTAPKKETKSNG